MHLCSLGTSQYFLLGMRVFFGSWLLYVGIAKWLFFGPNEFVNHIVQSFSVTWSPAFFNEILAWIIIIAEPVLGVLILLGKSPRLVWTATSFLMFLLVLGQTLLMKPDVIANWQYLVLTWVCAALSAPCCEKSGSCCKHE